MTKNKMILFAHDFSEASKNALDHAADLSHNSNNRLFIYHVVSISRLPISQSNIATQQFLEAKNASALIRRAITYLKKKYVGLKIAFEVEQGDFIPLLNKKITEIKAELVVIGVKKRTGLEKMIFGDTASDLIGKLNTPMLVVPLNAKKIAFDDIVYAWDGKSMNVNPLEILTLIGIHANSSIKAVNVSHYDEEIVKLAYIFKIALRKALNSFKTEVILISGLNKEREFEKTVKKIKPNIIVVYAHNYSFWQNLLHQRFSKHALKFSTVPVLVVT